MYLLNMRFAHVYLHHRYSLESLMQVRRRHGLHVTRCAATDRRRHAYSAGGRPAQGAGPGAGRARAVRSSTVPERVLAIIPPPPPGFNTDMTWIEAGGGTAFDAGDAGRRTGDGSDRLSAAIVSGRRDWCCSRPAMRSAARARRSDRHDRQPHVGRTGTAPRRRTRRAARDAAGGAGRPAGPRGRQGGDARRSRGCADARRQLDSASAATPARDAAARAHAAAARRDIARFLAGDDVRSRAPVSRSSPCRGRKVTTTEVTA